MRPQKLWILPTVLAGLLCFFNEAKASGFDIEAWLRRPGVKLVAVEFYATWCKPCMAAVPRWKLLHEKYRAQGLRLVVVATQDPEGGCANPGWSPDKVVCDDEGALAERFGASKLPAAYLWGWQGDLLVKRGHIDDVESAITGWMRKTPRVDVAVERVVQGVDRQDLEARVRSTLQDQGKLIVVATEAERRALRKIQAASLSESASEALQCEVGQEITANSLLKVFVTGGSRKRLRLTLLSAEKGCLVASAVSDWNTKRPSASVLEAVSVLTSKLKRKVQMPWLSSKPVEAKKSKPVASSFSGLDDELSQAKADEARAKQLEEDWKRVERYAKAKRIQKNKRVAQLEKFLSVYPNNNPREADAQRLIAQLSGKRSGETATQSQVAPLTPPSPPPPLARKLSRAQVSNTIRRGLGKLKACGKGGLATVRFSVLKSGRVSTIVVSSKDLDTRTKSCISRAFKKFRFPSFNGASMHINYPVRL